MVLKQPFTTTSPLIATFEFKDLASGQGFIDLFLTKSTSSEYNLFDKATFSDEIKLDNNGTFTFNSSIFQLTRTIEGEALLQASMRINASGSNKNITVNATLKLVSDDTTTIGTFQSISKSSSGNTFFLSSGKATIEETVIKVGDYLQLEVVLTGDNGYGNLFIDPDLRTSGVQGTSKLSIPFRIGL